MRAVPGVKAVFAKIWGTSDLIVSMDCVLLWRRWWHLAGAASEALPPRSEGLHLDQNPVHKPDLECVQGMVPLLPVTPAVGGLQVVPHSHTLSAREALIQTCPRLCDLGDWCPLEELDVPIIVSMKKDAILVEADAGDLILWDSRTVHGGWVGTGARPDTTACAATGRAAEAAVGAMTPTAAGTASDAAADAQRADGADPRDMVQAEVVRLACTVAMTPRARASSSVLHARRVGFATGRTFNHVPHEAGTSSGTVQSTAIGEYAPIELTQEQRALL